MGRPSLLLSALLVACSSSSERVKPPCEGVAPDAREPCLTEHYFASAPATPNEPCFDFVTSEQKVGARREVAFFTGAGVADSAAVEEGQSIHRFYAPYDLTFFTATVATPIGLEYAINGTDEEIDQILGQVGLERGSTPTPEQQKQLDRLVGDVFYRELRKFILDESPPPKRRVNVVVLSEMASPDMADWMGRGLGGFGVSRRLLEAVKDEEEGKAFAEFLALPADFTPTLFLGHATINRYASNRDSVVAHEMGHALGLEHVNDLGNLMMPVLPSGEVYVGPERRAGRNAACDVTGRTFA